jgi:AraC-like DNA-binding protein
MNRHIENPSPQIINDHIDSLTGLYKVSDIEANRVYSFLEKELKADTSGEVLKSVYLSNKVLEDNINKENWVSWYFSIVYDLNNRGFPNKAYRLLLFMDESNLDKSELFTFYSLRAQSNLWGGNFSNAMSWYQMALEIAYELNDPEKLFTIKNNIATLFTQTKDYESALRYILYGEEMLVKGYKLDLQSTARFYANAGVAFRRVGELDKAEKSYLKSLEISESNDFTMMVAQNYANLGNLYKDKSNYEMALDSYTKSFRISEGSNIEFGIIANQINRGSAYRLMGDYDKALETLNLAEARIVNTPLSNMKRSLYEEFVKLGNATGNEEMSAKYEAMYKEIDEQINSLEKQNDLLRNQNALDLKVIEREMFIRNAQFRLAQSRNKLTFVFFIIALISTILIIIFLKRKHRILYNLYLRGLETSAQSGLPVISVYNLPSAKTCTEESSNQRHFLKEFNDYGELILDNSIEMKTFDVISETPFEEFSDGSTLHHDKLEEIYQQVLDLFQKEKLFTNSELTLDSFAAILGTNKKYLSMSINYKSGLNFNEFVNSYRVEFAVRILLEERFRNLALKQLQSKCGFGSEATFHRVFKQITGLTPLQFRRQSRNQNAIYNQ